jgi:hypothetical protein
MKGISLISGSSFLRNSGSSHWVFFFLPSRLPPHQRLVPPMLGAGVVACGAAEDASRPLMLSLVVRVIGWAVGSGGSAGAGGVCRVIVTAHTTRTYDAAVPADIACAAAPGPQAANPRRSAACGA